VRVAVAGLGSACVRGHLPALRRLQAEGRLSLVGAADPNADRHPAVGCAGFEAPTFERAEEMLAATHPDLLVIATQPDAHASLALQAARRHQHVLCEKPLTILREEHELIAQASAGCPTMAVVSVHQYRYAAVWTHLSRLARLADRLGMPFRLEVNVERQGTDRHANTQWRTDIRQSGGVLADHAVHFLALGWTISHDVQALAASRVWECGHERSSARVRFGSGVLELSVFTGAAGRRTRLSLSVGALRLIWHDGWVRARAGGVSSGSWRVGALSDRNHVDRLYLPLYRELADRLHQPSWRKRRTAEALAVGAVLIQLLDLASAATGAP
jgi:predicted dehydrogenase